MTESLEAPQKDRDTKIALLQVFVLLAFSLLLYWPQLDAILHAIVSQPDAAHAYAAPIMILILLWFRRNDLKERLQKGSLWGIALILFGISLYGISSWPFHYGYPKMLSGVITITGIILIIFGWRFLYRCLPIVFLLLLAIPTGSRTFARVIITPETYTLEAVRFALDLLPDITITLDGQDIYYLSKDGSGVIAHAEPHRGAQLLLVYMMMCVFVTFVRVRPLWQIITLAILSFPVVLCSNFVRVALWGVITIYTEAEPSSGVPRTISAILGLIFAYILFGLVILLINSLFVEGEVPNTKALPTNGKSEVS